MEKNKNDSIKKYIVSFLCVWEYGNLGKGDNFKRYMINAYVYSNSGEILTFDELNLKSD